MKRAAANFVRMLCYYLFRVFLVNPRKIFVQNFNGKGYGGDPKYIVEELLRRGADVEIVWAVSGSAARDFPEGVRIARHKSIRAFYEEATAGIWIDNCRKQPYVRKRKNQFYIQTWHGILGPKKMEKYEEDRLSPYYVNQAKRDSRLIDLFLSDGGYATHLIVSSFWYDGEIAPFGYPRIDILVNAPGDVRKKVFDAFNLDNGAHVILYAPTFREITRSETYQLDYEAVIRAASQTRGGEWVVLVRLHPNVADMAGIIQYTDQVRNASLYDDPQELFLASDMLITDYSDCMCDFSFTKKPVFLYLNDYEEYQKERGFLYDLFALPFPAARNGEELMTKIIELDYNTYLEELSQYHRRLEIVEDGHAAERVVDRIIEEINKS